MVFSPINFSLMRSLFYLFCSILCAISLDVQATNYYVATTGSDSNTGTLVTTPYKTIAKALAKATVAGDTIFVRQGTYTYSTNSPMKLSATGTETNRICLFAYPGDQRPVVDFSGQTKYNSSARGFNISGKYWHMKGFCVYNAGDNGIYVSGENNIVEFCDMYDCGDSGMQIGNGAANNTIINCDSYFNKDEEDGNADGFACKLDVGTGNRFFGCRAWNNSDDGWDGYLRPSNNITTTLTDCWVIQSGYLKDGSQGQGNGNGFKTAGSDNKDLRHHQTLIRCIAVGNMSKGFDQNNNKGNMTIYNCLAMDNVKNYGFSSGALDSDCKLTIKNSIAIGAAGNFCTPNDITNNSWQNSLTATSVDFESLDWQNQLKLPRKADGALPDITFAKLLSTSDLIDQGVNIGEAFVGTAPDLGPFEFGTTSSTDIAPISTTLLATVYSVPNTLKISHVNTSLSVAIYTASGLLLLSETIDSDVSFCLPQGVVIVRLSSRDASSITKTIIK